MKLRHTVPLSKAVEILFCSVECGCTAEWSSIYSQYTDGCIEVIFIIPYSLFIYLYRLAKMHRGDRGILIASNSVIVVRKKRNVIARYFFAFCFNFFIIFNLNLNWHGINAINYCAIPFNNKKIYLNLGTGIQ